MFFDNLPKGQKDPMFELKKHADADKSPGKVDLGVGIYRNEQGRYHEMACLQEVSEEGYQIGLVRISRLTDTFERLKID
jgi:aspartate aminotransferase